MDIHKNALLVKLTIHSWGEERRSHEVEEAGAEKFGAHRNRLKAVKKLIVSPKLRDLQNAQRDMYNTHRKWTLPWEDGTYRLLTCQAYQPYLEAIRKCGNAVEAALTSLCDEWDTLIEKGKEEQDGLGQLWKQEDYPTVGELKESVGHELSMKPVPTSGDIRVEGLTEEDVQKLKDDLEAQVKEREKAAVEAVWNKLYEAANHLHARVTAVHNEPEKARLHQSSLDNLVSLGEILPALNISKDPMLDEIAGYIKEKLGGVTKDQVRESSFMRGTAIGVCWGIMEYVGTKRGIRFPVADEQVKEAEVEEKVEEPVSAVPVVEEAKEDKGEAEEPVKVRDPGDFMRNFKRSE